MDTNQYMDMFLDESREHLQAINANTLKLEKNSQDILIVNEIFRSAHTLKGMAATMGFEDIASLTHQMENVLDLIRNEQLAVTTTVIDVTFEAIDFLEIMVSNISEGGEGKKDISALVERLSDIENDGSSLLEEVRVTNLSETGLTLDQFESAIESKAKALGVESYQLTVHLNEDCLLKAVRVFMVFEALEILGDVVKSVPNAEELQQGNFERSFTVLLLSKENANVIENRLLNISEIHHVDISIFKQNEIEFVQSPSEEKLPIEKTEEDSKSNSQGTSSTIRVNIERIDTLMNLFEEMVIDRGRLEDLSKKSGDVELVESVERLNRVSQDMQSLILSMRMVPIEQVFNRFPRMIRGLAKDLKKEIKLDIIGADTELDRTVIDEIGDPLVHLIRNSIDHGIESPVHRFAAGKESEGTISLKAYHSGNHVLIEIRDDGNGISREKVLKKAIQNGLVTSEYAQNLTDTDVFNFIFASGFSTAEKVSDLSGRGVGLDVVRTKIEKLGGQVFVQSEQGKGSLFTIKLPLTLSILTTLLVKVQDQTFAIPLPSIEETMSIKRDRIMHMEGQQVMDFRNKITPLIFLKDVFNVTSNEKEGQPEQESIVIIRNGEKTAGLVVDSLIGQKDVVLKSLGEYLGEVEFLSGATILGDGSVSLIIDPNSFVN